MVDKTVSVEINFPSKLIFSYIFCYSYFYCCCCCLNSHFIFVLNKLFLSQSMKYFCLLCFQMEVRGEGRGSLVSVRALNWGIPYFNHGKKGIFRVIQAWGKH